MARENVVVCDRCGKRPISHEKGSLAELFVELPQARACAEDDTSYVETVDLCCKCAATLLNQWLEAKTFQERAAYYGIVKGGRK